MQVCCNSVTAKAEIEKVERETAGSEVTGFTVTQTHATHTHTLIHWKSYVHTRAGAGAGVGWSNICVGTVAHNPKNKYITQLIRL